MSSDLDEVARPSDGSVLLIRHGQSVWNAARRWQGMADTPLSELGQRQAASAAGALAALDIAFAEMWSSQLSRARQTASIIAEILAIEPVRHEERLREVDAGPWQGLTPDEIEQRWPGYLAGQQRPDGFEATEIVLERTMAALGDLARRGRELGAPIAAVTHSGVIRTLRQHLGGRGQRIANLEAVWITASPDRSGRLEFGLGPSLVLVDDRLSTVGAFERPGHIPVD